MMGASLYRTLHEVFPIVRAVPGSFALLIAGSSAEAVTLDPNRLAARWRQRNIQSDVFAAELLPDLYPAERIAALESQLNRSALRVAPSRDNQPVSFIYALAVREQFARSAWAAILKWGVNHPKMLSLASIVPSTLLLGWMVLRRTRRAAVAAIAHATATTGATGMALSLMLFFSFQTRVGALYSELGLLSALFMLGLAAGGAFAVRRLSLMAAQLGSSTAVALLTLCFALLDKAEVSLFWATAIHGLWLVLAGAATGAVFPSAAKALLDLGFKAPGAASLTQFADHGGAALAALVAAVLFVPILGLIGSAGLLLFVQALAVLGILVGNSRAVQDSVTAVAP